MTLAVADFERLLDVSALLTSTLELDAVLTKVLELAGDLMQAEASNVMLLDAAKKELVYQVVLGEAGRKIKEEKRLKVGVGIAGWVAQNVKPLRVDDAYQDPRFFRDFDRKTGFRTKNILCLPLIAKEKLIGVAQIINKKGAPCFSEDDQALFKRFCDIAAISIDSAILHRKAREQDRLQRDIQLAEEVQRASWPSRVPSFPNLRVEYRSLPCRHVGGDVMAINRLGDGRLAVLVGDVSGKGVPAALFAAKFQSDFEHQNKGDFGAGALFTRLNSVVASRSTRGMYITAVYAVFDPVDGSVELVNAGHLEPLILGPENGRLRAALAPEFPPLGVLDECEYEPAAFKLARGEQIVFMTDGVTDAKAPSGARLGAEAAQRALADHPTLAVTRLMRLIRDFTGGQPLADDITVAAVGFGDYEEVSMTAESASLAPLRRFLESRMKGRGLSDKRAGRILLAATEAAANVIEHTYAGVSDGELLIGTGWRGHEFTVSLRDWGPKQDPSRFSSRDLEDVRPGGLGVHFIKETADPVEFDDSLFEGNELHMLFGKPEGPLE